MADEGTVPEAEVSNQETEQTEAVPAPGETAEQTSDPVAETGDNVDPTQTEGAATQTGSKEKGEEPVFEPNSQEVSEEVNVSKDPPQVEADVSEGQNKGNAEEKGTSEEPEHKDNEEQEKADKVAGVQPVTEEGKSEEKNEEGEAGVENPEVNAEVQETEGEPAGNEEKGEEPPSEQAELMQDVVPSEEKKETVAMETEATEEMHEVDPNAKSPSPVNAGPSTATVKFVLMPSGHVTTMACSLSITMEDIKADLASLLRMPSDKLVIMYDSAPVEEAKTLTDLGVGVNGAVQLEVSSTDPVNIPIKPPRPQPEYNMPHIITVKIDRDDATSQEIVVEIERATRHKPFVGGFRNRLTGVEYLHASAQTRAKLRADNGIAKFCRDTQTVSQKNKAQQVTRNTFTQMTTIGCYVANLTDKLLTPGKYTTAYEFHARRLNAVIVLQSFFRRWQAKRHVIQLKEDMIRRAEWERQEEMRKIREKEERIRMEFERRMNPKTKEDFDLLYHALEKWRQEELESINASLSGPTRKAALCHLLDQETQLIAAIGRHKLQADTENKQKAIQNFLDKAAAPRRWKSADGKYTEMDTAYTVRARELKDIHTSLNMKYLTQDERLDALLTLKHTVKEHDCKLTQEIIELIDREADLLMRGTKETNLEGLRKRISTLFLQYIKTPTFNAEAARLLKVPQDPSSLRKNVYFCPSCSNYLPSTEFQLSSTSTGVGRCRRCNKLDNDARERQDFSHYRYMLKALRRSEEAFQDGSKIAFLLQEADLRYLVEEIWNSQSTLSAWSDLYDLVLIRWDRDEEWSPWNCVLLTKDEATAHFQIENLEKNYGRVFCHKVRTKHTLSRNYFSRLPGMAEVMRQWSSGNANTGLITSKPIVTLKAK